MTSPALLSSVSTSVLLEALIAKFDNGLALDETGSPECVPVPVLDEARIADGVRISEHAESINVSDVRFGGLLHVAKFAPPSIERGSETSRTPPSRTNCPRPPAEHGAHHQQDTHRGPCVYPQISKYRGRGRPRAPYYHSFPGLLSLASNGPRISGPMEHDSSSGRHHSRLPACHALFGEVEGRASQHNHFDAFPGRTNIQLLLSVFVSNRERVDLCSVQVFNV